MSNFVNLREIIKQFQTDPATENDPVKRMFICDGESITANIAKILRRHLEENRETYVKVVKLMPNKDMPPHGAKQALLP